MPNPVHITCGMILRYGSKSRGLKVLRKLCGKLPFGDNFFLKTKGIFEGSRIFTQTNKRGREREIMW